MRRVRGKGTAMIFTSIENVADNDLTRERFAQAIEWLRTTDLTAVPLGRNEISGDDAVFANVMEFTTVDAAEKDYEAHRRYADIHCVISGTERIGIAAVDEVEPQGAFDKDADFGVYAHPLRESWVTLREGDIVVTPPCDAHKPGCSVDGPAPLRKACVKVLVS